MRYGHLVLARRFSWKLGISHFTLLPGLGIASRRYAPRICLRDRLPAYTGTSNRPLYLSFFVAPSLITNFGGTGIMTSCPSPTLFSLGLGPANPGTINVAQETLGLRRTRFSRVSRYLCRHSHFRALHWSSRSSFTARRTLLYHDVLRRHP